MNQSKNFPGVSPLLNFEKFEAALLGSRSAQDDETLHANFRGRMCKSAIGQKRIRDEKIFLTLLYGMFFSAKIGLYKKVHCVKTKNGSEKQFSDMKSTGNLPQDQVVSKGI